MLLEAKHENQLNNWLLINVVNIFHIFEFVLYTSDLK